MSTYWDWVVPVAMSKTIGVRWVTGSPLKFVPVARRTRLYSPGPSEPPLTLTVTFWLFWALVREIDEGLTLTAPIPAGSTPPSATLPSMLRFTVPRNAVAALFVVPYVTVPVAVRPVLAIDSVCAAFDPTVGTPKSRPTPPTLIATG